jgi:hypothetical protein
MKLLAPQVLACDLVDRYDIWVNTADQADLAFLHALPQLDPKRPDRVRLVAQPDGKEPGWGAIHGFHRTTLDMDTIYVRLDDDVVWLEPGFFETLLRFRIENPRHFLVMPLIINNALCTHILHTCGKIKASPFVTTNCMDPVGWGDPLFAVALHRFFLGLLARREAHKLHCGAREVSLNRFSINAICWFGRDMAAIGGEVAPSEEEDLSNIIPARLGRTNCFCTDTIAAHFAFYPQRNMVDRAGLLEEYVRDLAGRKDLAPLLDEAANICAVLDAQFPQQPAAPAPKRRKRRSLWARLFMRRSPPRRAPAQLHPGASL